MLCRGLARPQQAVQPVEQRLLQAALLPQRQRLLVLVVVVYQEVLTINTILSMITLNFLRNK